MPSRDLVILRAAGSAVALVTSPDRMPRVLHWGGELGGDDAAYQALGLLDGGPVPFSALDEASPFTVLPTEADGWEGTAGLRTHRGGGGAAPRWERVESVWDRAARTLLTTGHDPRNGLRVGVRHSLDDHGVLTVGLSVTSTGQQDRPPVDVAALRALMPLPSRATQILDLTGRWGRERSPQRSPLVDGTHLRRSTRGRTGHDATLLLTAGTPGFGFRHGEVWSAHVAWSGNHEHLVERLPEGAGMHAAVLGGGEALLPGEVRLAAGETYAAPDVIFAHSASGLDGISRRLHRSQRDRPGYRATARPLVLNTWEAVYFDADLGHLKRLADVAASVGVERFVLDDGWFGARRHDRAGLGDWWVSPQVWPGGLAPLVEHVRGLGMEFGLWFEPEMVNADSDLVREHSDWVLGPRAGRPREWRHQQVLDLANPAAFQHVLEAVSALVAEHAIDFVKWDHNRDLLEAVRGEEGIDAGAGDHPAVHAQTTALYALLDELRRRHPGLEIESCASGGARIDLGVLDRTDRVWTSDCNDALERASIQRWTTLLVPPERMGSHVGPPTAHTTHRTLDLSLRCLIALQGHAGLEWDLTGCSQEELQALRSWSALYRELRALLHTGDVVRADLPDDSLQVSGVVARDGAQAAYTVVRLATSAAAAPGLVRLPGLDGGRDYIVRVRPEAGLPRTMQRQPPAWWEQALGPGVRLPGGLLDGVGLPMPVLAPAQGFLLQLTDAAPARPRCPG